MNRRQFLAGSAIGLLNPFSLNLAGTKRIAPATITQKILVKCTLDGGPDFRHLFVPPYDSDPASYGYNYWLARYTSHELTNNPSEWQQRYLNNYTEVSSNGQTFGILNSASWLIEQFNAGNVAIINNVIGSTSRDHSFSQIVLESGNANSTPTQFSQSGWGGRMANYLSANVVSAARRVRLFCNGPHATRDYDNSNVISFNDSRNFGLYHNPILATTPDATDTRSIMSRSLKSYYQAKRNTISAPFDKFTTIETNLRNFGDLVNARYETSPLPAAIENLTSTYLGRQIRNIYDAYVCSDIINFRVGSMELGGWDTHKNQLSIIESNFNSLFGSSSSFSVLYDSLQANVVGALDNSVFVIAGEFGRQLASNGDGGTDHGRGNSVIVMGNNVNGGVYGSMFPLSELESTGFIQSGSDISGLTSMAVVFGRVCDWVADTNANGTGNTIVDRSAIIEETSGLLDGLFS